MSKNYEEIISIQKEQYSKEIAKLKEQAENEFSQQIAMPFMSGVQLAVNAIKDLYLLIDGPDCSYMKSQFIQGNHDLMSTLTNVNGFHRITSTAIHPSMIIGNREDKIYNQLHDIANREFVNYIGCSSMPMATITGIDYERICKKVQKKTGVYTFHIPGKSLDGDWLDGYSETLLSIAKILNLKRADNEKQKVAVIGNLFDRNEADNVANISEIKHMLAMLDLEVTSIWLSGDNFSELLKVQDAGTIISLPYGRRAAKLVAERINADLLELDIPFGLQATVDWISNIANHFDKQNVAEKYIDKKLSFIIPRLEWIIPYTLQGAKVGIIGDPFIAKGVLNCFESLGPELSFVAITNKRKHVKEEDFKNINHIIYPKMNELNYFMISNIGNKPIDLLVSCYLGNMMMSIDTAIVEFGFPSAFNHALFEKPYMGFNGFLAFIDRVVNSLMQTEVQRINLKKQLRYYDNKQSEKWSQLFD